MKVIEFPKDNDDRDRIVEQLEYLVGLAKEGGIISFAFVGMNDEDDVFMSASTDSLIELVGLLDIAKQSAYLP